MAMSFAGNYFNLSPEEVGKGFSPTFLGAQPIFDVNKIQPPSGNAEFSPELKEKLKDLSAHYSLRELSMGMSNDYMKAIQNGATYVRIGSAIFNEN
jgi:hypothetical protein